MLPQTRLVYASSGMAHGLLFDWSSRSWPAILEQEKTQPRNEVKKQSNKFTGHFEVVRRISFAELQRHSHENNVHFCCAGTC